MKNKAAQQTVEVVEEESVAPVIEESASVEEGEAVKKSLHIPGSYFAIMAVIQIALMYGGYVYLRNKYRMKVANHPFQMNTEPQTKNNSYSKKMKFLEEQHVVVKRVWYSIHNI